MLKNKNWIRLSALMLLVSCAEILPNVNDGTVGINGTMSVDRDKGIATDDTTGMKWQNSQIAHGERVEAQQHCASLDLAGLSGWRLPTSAELQRFHVLMNKQNSVPEQAFDRCTAEVTSDGYVRTKKGADQYGGEPGDPINFSGGANIRCIQ